MLVTNKLATPDSILSQHREHEVLVGLCGSSGAGKSSLINALLGMKDFLPEGHHYAMTAVVCRIAYSHRPESQKPCRAIIELQSKESVTEDLKQLLEDFRERHNLQSHSDRSLMSSEQLSHVETLDDEIRQRLDRFGPLLGLTEAGLRSDHEVCKGIEGADQLAKSFLEKEPRLTEVLCHGRIDESFASTSDLSTFAKPYLSSEAKGDDQRTFQAWPVITTVELQIPHPLLRHGIVLVDLPGRGDVNEARVAVAEEYENKLDLVLAVSPTVRAASERTMAELLSSHQKARLETNGTLGGKRIAAVVTKTDDLKMDAEIAGGPLAIAKTRQAASERSDEAARWDQRIEELQDALDTGADSLQAIRDNQQDLIMCLVRGAADINSESRTRNFDKVPPGRYVKNTMRSGSKTLKQADHLKKVAEQRRDVASLKEEFERQKLRCLQVKARNGLVRTCLLRSLNSNAGTKSPEEDETHSISVFCTSSEALWCSLAGKPLVGFPQLSHSEVPALRLWIAERAAQHSEQNLNSIFARLKTAFQLMQVWCSTEGYESQLDAPQQAKVTRQAILDADRVLCEVISRDNPLNLLKGTLTYTPTGHEKGSRRFGRFTRQCATLPPASPRPREVRRQHQVKYPEMGSQTPRPGGEHRENDFWDTCCDTPTKGGYVHWERQRSAQLGQQPVSRPSVRRKAEQKPALCALLNFQSLHLLALDH